MLDVAIRSGWRSTLTVISRLMQSDAPLAGPRRRSGQIRAAAVHRRISLEPATVAAHRMGRQPPAKYEMWRLRS